MTIMLWCCNTKKDGERQKIVIEFTCDEDVTIPYTKTRRNETTSPMNVDSNFISNSRLNSKSSSLSRLVSVCSDVSYGSYMSQVSDSDIMTDTSYASNKVQHSSPLFHWFQNANKINKK